MEQLLYYFEQVLGLSNFLTEILKSIEGNCQFLFIHILFSVLTSSKTFFFEIFSVVLRKLFGYLI